MTLSLAEFNRRIDAISKAIRSVGGEVQEVIMEPPATKQEIELVEHQLGAPLPDGFKHALLHLSREFSFQWFLPEDEYDKVWHDKLAFMEVGNGDYLAFDLKGEPDCPVVYLSHDDGQGHGYILAHDFMELLDKWSQIAFVGAEDWQWLMFVESKNRGIHIQNAAAQTWRELIGLNLKA